MNKLPRTTSALHICAALPSDHGSTRDGSRAGATSDPVGDVTSNGGAGAQSSAQGSASTTTTTTQQQEKYSHLVSSGAGGDSSVQRSTPDFLVLVLDCNPFGWAAAAAEGGRGGSGSGPGSAAAELERTLRDVLIFLNAHLALQHDNGVAVYAAAGGQAQLLFSTASHSAPFRFGLDPEDGAEEEDDEGRKPDANSFQHFRALDAQVFKGVRSLLKQASRVMGDEVQEMLDEAAGNAMDVDQANGRENGQAEKKRQRMGATGIVSALAQALCRESLRWTTLARRYCSWNSCDSYPPPTHRHSSRESDDAGAQRQCSRRGHCDFHRAADGLEQRAARRCRVRGERRRSRVPQPHPHPQRDARRELAVRGDDECHLRRTEERELGRAHSVWNCSALTLPTQPTADSDQCVQALRRGQRLPTAGFALDQRQLPPSGRASGSFAGASGECRHNLCF